MVVDPWLIIPGVDCSVWSYPIVKGRQTLGRSPDCAILVIHPRVSRVHAEIERRGDRLTIRDRQSRHGLRINDAPREQAPLKLGDRIGLADVELRVVEAAQLAQDEAEELTLAAHEPARPEAPRLNGAPLTATEARVLDLLLRGLAEKQIAARLFVSPHTVHTHVKRIYQAMGVHSRAELLARCLVRQVTTREIR